MTKEPLKNQAYRIIRDNICSCVYAPGSIINEELIREDIHMSRTPIRDALSRLEQEGLIRIMPKKGIVISEITVRELNMLYETRSLLEPYVVKHYGSQVPPDIWLHYYRLYHDYLDGKTKDYSYDLMDESFHQVFIDASQNSYFRNLYSTIGSQIRRTRVVSGRASKPRLEATVQEHITIVDAALKNDWKAASAAMQHHLNMSKNAIFDYILKQEG
ncbi:MAG: GntR family transcriptional regulator [Eubacteriales bacterium]|nr:GntR family transcriptional regulator [Eubacteriales bacterium]